MSAERPPMIDTRVRSLIDAIDRQDPSAIETAADGVYTAAAHVGHDALATVAKRIEQDASEEGGRVQPDDRKALVDFLNRPTNGQSQA